MFLLRIRILLSTVCAAAVLVGCGAISLFSGCALSPHVAKEMSREECADTEWQEVGLHDGRSGTPHGAEFNRYVSECSKYSENLNSEKAAYARGLEEGYVVYCHKVNAEQMGVLGSVFHDEFCSQAERDSLVRAYHKGLARAKTSPRSKVN